ncbi:MAG: amidohydrolase [Acidimicrobiia bacterium]|nr:amidohydrolase [Acidimicrobiia bacterium]
MIIDVHAHCIPSEFRSWLETADPSTGIKLVQAERGTSVEMAGRAVSQPLRPDLTDLDARLAAMDRQGVDVQVLAGWIDLTAYELPTDQAVAYSRIHNEALAGEAARAPERFRTIGTMPLQNTDASVDALNYAMDELGMAGVELATTVDGAYIDRLDLDPFWAAAEEKEAFVLLHPMTPLTGVDMSKYFMENMVARPAESTIAMAGLIFSGVFERFPDLKFCVVHGGGFMPYQIGRLDKGYEMKPGLTAKNISKPPRAYLKQMYLDTVVHDAGALRYLVEVMGADHILLGTDYPFEMGDDDPVAFIKSAGLTAEQEAMILSGNAERLFS